MTVLGCGHETTLDLPPGSPITCHGEHSNGRTQATYAVGTDAKGDAGG